MKISYLFNSSLPSDLPSSLQVAKMCEGMRKIADEVKAKGGGSKFMAVLNIENNLSFSKILNTGKNIITKMIKEYNDK